MHELEYDFYACGRCRSLITQPELAVTLETGVPPCSCGSMKIQPTNLRWYHWLLPRVLKFAYQRLRGLA